MTQAIRAIGLSVLIATCAALAAGCKKDDKQSLVLAELKLAMADPSAAGLTSVTLMASPGPTKTFLLSTTLSADTGVLLGLYVSGSITGDVTIDATARRGSDCMGFRGTGTVTIDAPGMTWPVLITMRPDDVCASDGGAAGSGGGAGGTTGAGGRGGGTAGTGTAGAGGAAGTGTAGTGGGGTAGASGTAGGGRGGGAGGSTGGMGGMAGYPSITSCRPFNHGMSSCANASLRTVAISPDGRFVASAGNDYRVKIWNFDGVTLTPTGTVLPDFTGYGLAFSPDGSRLLHTAGTTVRTFTVSTWAASTIYQNEGSSNDMVSAAFTPNGLRIVSADGIGNLGGDVFAHEVGGSALPAFMKHVSRQPASLAVSTVASSDGTAGVVVGTYNATVQVLTLGPNGFTEPIVLPSSHTTGAVWAVGFSRDGSLVAQADDFGVLRFWSFPVASATAAPAGTDITFAGGDTINGFAFSPNRTYVAVGGGFNVSQLSIYNLATRMEIDRTTLANAVSSVVFSPNGAAIIAGLDDCGTVIVCN